MDLGEELKVNTFLNLSASLIIDLDSKFVYDQSCRIYIGLFVMKVVKITNSIKSLNL